MSIPVGQRDSASLDVRHPRCPVTGEPAVRLVQWVGASFLRDLWRHTTGVDPASSFRGTKRFGLWESPTGLHFFDPPRPGDGSFYASLYGGPWRDMLPKKGRPRGEFELAAGRIARGARVLDVGCGTGVFRHSLRDADYVGLDPHFTGDPSAPWVRIETLASHLDRHAGTYDVVTAFEVVEHVADALAMIRDMARALRPGGLLILGVPHVPSAHTRVPNNPINAPPHHITWWTAPALHALAARAGLVDAEVAQASWTRYESQIYWAARCSPVRCRDVFYRHAWPWHASALLGYFLGQILGKLAPIPRPGTDEGPSLVLFARRPE